MNITQPSLCSHTQSHRILRSIFSDFSLFLNLWKTSHSIVLAQTRKPCYRRMSPGNSIILICLLIHSAPRRRGSRLSALFLSRRESPQVNFSSILRRYPICSFTTVLQQNNTNIWGIQSQFRLGISSLNRDALRHCPGTFRSS